MRSLRTRALLAFVAFALASAAAPGLATAQAVYTSLASLRSAAGEDPRASAGRLRIPTLGVDAPIGRHAVPLDAPRMSDPYGPGDVAWYDFAEPRFGGALGGGGNAVISGHVDYDARVAYADARYRGPGVFRRLGELRPGDVVEVERNGRTSRYLVSWVRVVGEAPETWSSLLRSDVPIASLTLYTCDGIFDPVTRTYSQRLVVRAELVEGRANRLPAPVGGPFTIGVSGTTHPAALVAAQRWPVEAVYTRDARSGEWLVYRPGAPAFTNSLLGRLRSDSYVIVQFAR